MPFLVNIYQTGMEVKLYVVQIPFSVFYFCIIQKFWCFQVNHVGLLDIHKKLYRSRIYNKVGWFLSWIFFCCERQIMLAILTASSEGRSALQNFYLTSWLMLNMWHFWSTEENILICSPWCIQTQMQSSFMFTVIDLPHHLLLYIALNLFLVLLPMCFIHYWHVPSS